MNWSFRARGKKWQRSSGTVATFKRNGGSFAPDYTAGPISVDGHVEAVHQYGKVVLDGAENKICVDRFHVAGHLGRALDKTRAAEHCSLLQGGERPLTRTRHDWLRRRLSGQTGISTTHTTESENDPAWRIKEAASSLWSYSYRKMVEQNWKSLLSWISRCRLTPMTKVRRVIRRHLGGILNAIVHRATRAIAESINASTQKDQSKGPRIPK